MTQIKYLAFPRWFWNSDTFKLEQDSTSPNFNSVKERTFDYSKFPQVPPPTTKIVTHGDYKYDVLKAIEGQAQRRDIIETVGYTHFQRFKGIDAAGSDGQPFFNVYPNSKLFHHSNEGDSNGNALYGLPQLAATDEEWQYINAESNAIGYFPDATQIANTRALMDSLHAQKPQNKYSFYAPQVFPIWSKFYGAKDGDSSKADELCSMLDSPPDSQFEAMGADYLLEDVYSLQKENTQVFTAIGIFTKQLARKKFALTNKSVYSKVIYLIWSKTENFGFQFRYRKNNGTMVVTGEIDGLAKQPANPEHNYNLILHGLTGADGVMAFADKFSAFGSVNIEGQMRDLELENVNDYTQVKLRNQIYAVAPAIIPAASYNMLTGVGLWQTSLLRTLLDSTQSDWFTPDFVYNGNLRTGKFKQIPYNIYLKEPTVEMKMVGNKVMIYAANLCNSPATVPKTINVKFTDNNNINREIPVVLKGNKAELVTISL